MKKILLLISILLYSAIYAQMNPREYAQYLDANFSTLKGAIQATDTYWSFRNLGSWSKVYKFYKDVDNDGFPDRNGEYIAYRNADGLSTSDEIKTVNIFDVNGLNTGETVTYKLARKFFDGNYWVMPYLVEGASYDYYDSNGQYVSLWHDSTNPINFIKDCNDNSSDSNYKLGIYYKDTDNDGYGDASATKPKYFPLFCPDNGYVGNNEDCNDNDSTITNQPVNWYSDFDNDGFGDSNSFINSCTSPGSYYVRNNQDCDDTNPNYNNKDITWYADLDGDGFGDPNDSIVASCPPLNYVTNCYFDECPTEAGTRENGCPLVDFDFDNQNQNYTYSRSYSEPVKSENLSSVNSDKVIENITYIDPAGRIIQENGIKIGATGNDIVKHYEYNGNGELLKEYLPYSKISSNGLLSNNAKQETLSYYNTTEYDNTVNPYTNSRVENSPLNRTLEVAAQGNTWQLDENNDTDHTVKYEYGINSTSDNVRKFAVNLIADNTSNPELVENSVFPEGALKKSIVKNENWQPNQEFSTDNTTETYEDERGRIILKRSFNKAEKIDTYYVYDVFDNLTYVLSPKLSLKSTITQVDLNDLAHQFKFDGKGRIIERKIPGKGWEFLVYDREDKIIFTQDALQRQRNKWVSLKYDFKNRLVLNTIYNRDISRESLQNEVNSNSSTQLFETRSNVNVLIDGENVFYSNLAFPVTTSQLEVNVVNYYDNYENVLPSGLTNTITTSFGIESSSNTTDLLTVSKKAILDTNHWITSVIYYDNNGRPIYVYSHNSFLNTIDIVEYKLDFLGKILQTNEIHKREGYEDISIVNRLDYDRAGRLLTQKQCLSKGEVNCNESVEDSVTLSSELNNTNGTEVINAANSIVLLPGFKATASQNFALNLKVTNSNTTFETIVENSYNELGQIIEKGVGGKGNQRLQKVNYAFNVRGWLKKINNDTANDNDLFNYSLKHEDATNEADKLYNGNISEISWNTLNVDSSTKKYTYQYDALNRLTKAIDNSAKYNVELSYDENGNIQTLNRQGHTNEEATVFGTMDDLTYDYDNGNKLKRVVDASGIDFGFKDVNNTNPDGTYVDDYTYDVNGNTTSDLNKGITSITYNNLNLPDVITTSQGTIKYVYDAGGKRLAKTVKLTTETDGKTTEYAGNYIYQNSGVSGSVSELQYINQTEGYIKYDDNQFIYVYQYKDHLGNIRLSYADINNDGLITSNSEILDESNYYPFGLKHVDQNSIFSSNGNSIAQKLGYNGKELEKGLGVNLYEMDWRSYDPSIGRWTVIDPVIHLSLSPYNAFDNNPIYFSDPSGADSEQVLSPPERDGEFDGEIVDRDGTSYIWDVVTKQWTELLDEVVVQGATNNKTGYEPTERDWEILEMIRESSPTLYKQIRGRYDRGEYFALGNDGRYRGFSANWRAGWLNSDPNGIGNTLSKLAAVTIGGTLVLSNPVVASFAVSGGNLSLGTVSQGFKGRMAYDFASELITNDFNIKKVNFLGVALTAVTGSKFVEVIGAGVDVTFADGIQFKSVEQTIVSFYAGRLNSNKLSTDGFVQSIGPAIIQGGVKKVEDYINSNLDNWTIFGAQKAY
ncbi:DUF6443 domain-containing protein [Tenacibaculum sp. MEBiC06402]|uniref:DUF6443 domain-containing protein n=1 Tax=unclassified Tenacibaculum TaxID=2635139 RepID=UPI003B9B665A